MKVEWGQIDFSTSRSALRMANQHLLAAIILKEQEHVELGAAHQHRSTDLSRQAVYSRDADHGVGGFGQFG